MEQKAPVDAVYATSNERKSGIHSAFSFWKQHDEQLKQSGTIPNVTTTSSPRVRASDSSRSLKLSTSLTRLNISGPASPTSQQASGAADNLGSPHSASDGPVSPSSSSERAHTAPASVSEVPVRIESKPELANRSTSQNRFSAALAPSEPTPIQVDPAADSPAPDSSRKSQEMQASSAPIRVDALPTRASKYWSSSTDPLASTTTRLASPKSSSQGSESTPRDAKDSIASPPNSGKENYISTKASTGPIPSDSGSIGMQRPPSASNLSQSTLSSSQSTASVLHATSKNSKRSLDALILSSTSKLRANQEAKESQLAKEEKKDADQPANVPLTASLSDSISSSEDQHVPASTIAASPTPAGKAETSTETSKERPSSIAKSSTNGSAADLLVKRRDAKSNASAPGLTRVLSPPGPLARGNMMGGSMGSVTSRVVSKKSKEPNTDLWTRSNDFVQELGGTTSTSTSSQSRTTSSLRRQDSLSNGSIGEVFSTVEIASEKASDSEPKQTSPAGDLMGTPKRDRSRQTIQTIDETAESDKNAQLRPHDMQDSLSASNDELVTSSVNPDDSALSGSPNSTISSTAIQVSPSDSTRTTGSTAAGESPSGSPETTSSPSLHFFPRRERPTSVAGLNSGIGAHSFRGTPGGGNSSKPRLEKTQHRYVLSEADSLSLTNSSPSSVRSGTQDTSSASSSRELVAGTTPPSTTASSSINSIPPVPTRFARTSPPPVASTEANPDTSLISAKPSKTKAFFSNIIGKLRPKTSSTDLNGLEPTSSKKHDRRKSSDRRLNVDALDTEEPNQMGRPRATSTSAIPEFGAEEFELERKRSNAPTGGLTGLLHADSSSHVKRNASKNMSLPSSPYDSENEHSGSGNTPDITASGSDVVASDTSAPASSTHTPAANASVGGYLTPGGKIIPRRNSMDPNAARSGFLRGLANFSGSNTSIDVEAASASPHSNASGKSLKDSRGKKDKKSGKDEHPLSPGPSTPSRHQLVFGVPLETFSPQPTPLSAFSPRSPSPTQIPPLSPRPECPEWLSLATTALLARVSSDFKFEEAFIADSLLSPKTAKRHLDDGSLDFDSADPKLLADAIHAFINELPDSVCTFRSYHDFAALLHVDDVRYQSQLLHSLVWSQLPMIHRNTLLLLVDFIVLMSGWNENTSEADLLNPQTPIGRKLHLLVDFLAPAIFRGRSYRIHSTSPRPYSLSDMKGTNLSTAFSAHAATSPQEIRRVVPALRKHNSRGSLDAAAIELKIARVKEGGPPPELKKSSSANTLASPRETPPPTGAKTPTGVRATSPAPSLVPPLKLQPLTQGGELKRVRSAEHMADPSILIMEDNEMPMPSISPADSSGPSTPAPRPSPHTSSVASDILKLIIARRDYIFALETPEYTFDVSPVGQTALVEFGQIDFLFDLLGNPHYKDGEFADGFFYAASQTLSPEEILARIMSRVRRGDAKKDFVRLRGALLLNAFKRWVHLNSELLASHAHFFVELRNVVHSSKDDDESFLLSDILADLTIAKSSLAAPQWPPSAMDIIHFEPLAGSIISQSFEVLAQHLTLIDSKHFKALKVRAQLTDSVSDFLHSEPFTRLTNHFNTVSRWVAHETVMGATSKDRAARVTYFAQVANALVSMNNFHSALAVFTGVTSVNVARMTKTMSSARKRSGKILDAIEELFSLSKNSRNYNERIRKCSLPIIPQIVLYAKNVASLDESNASYDGDKLNVCKFKDFVRITSDLLKYQKSVFYFHKDPSLYAALEGLSPPSDDEIYELSLKADPKK